MSMALGAFLMGMLLSGWRYSVQIQASVEPHKGLLMSLFFVAVGMSVHLGVLLAQPLSFALQLAALVTSKVTLVYGLYRMFGTAVAATELIRTCSARVTIVARARDLVACDALCQDAANIAFPEAVEASLKLAAETLEALGISEDATQDMIKGARGDDNALVRSELGVMPQVPPPGGGAAGSEQESEQERGS